ncbi:MAG: hypothetical protein PVI39_00650 [Desulfobacteraceae bacterium]
MKDRFTKRWLLVAALWGAAGLLTLGNTAAVNRLAPLQAIREQARMEADYCRRQAARIDEMVAKHDAYYHRVASANLGLLAVRETLRGLALSQGVALSRFESGADQPHAEQGASLTLGLAGPLAAGAAFLALVEQRYPYLPPAAVKIAVDGETGSAEFEISLHYRYRVIAAAQDVAGFPADAI